MLSSQRDCATPYVIADQLIAQIVVCLQQMPQHELHSLTLALKVEQQQIIQAIEWLQGVGVDIAIHANQVYLAAPLYLLNEPALKRELPCRVFYFQTLDSTNQFMLQKQQHLSSGDLCVAEYQTQGRGRQGKIWTAAYGQSLCFSLFHRMSIDPAHMSGISLVIGIAIVDCLSGLGIKDVSLKWPNDVYRHRKKLAGILIESHYDDNIDAMTLVIGVGLNLVQPTTEPEFFMADLSDKVNHQGFKHNLVIAFWHSIQAALNLYEQQGFEFFQQRWHQIDL